MGRNKIHIPTHIACRNMVRNIISNPWYYLSLYAPEYGPYSGVGICQKYHKYSFFQCD
jgi:hypothetical protein